MPIIDLQRRLREVGRIRIGEQVTTKTGKRAPKKLSTFRFTSRDARVIDEVAKLYGGTPKDWTSPDGTVQREVITDADELPVMIPPADMAFSQWFETWSAAGCIKRCDGRFDSLRDVACDCNVEARECRVTTRMSVILPEIPGLGVWRLETHGYYAAVELAAAVDLCRMASER